MTGNGYLSMKQDIYICVTALIANICFDFVLNIFGGTIKLFSVMTKEMLTLVNCRCNALLYVICKVLLDLFIFTSAEKLLSIHIYICCSPCVEHCSE